MCKGLSPYGIEESRVHLFQKIDSTSLEAMRCAREKAPKEPEVFIAHMQTAGRGRLGKSFVSVGGAGIYASYLLPCEVCRGDTLTPKAALVLSEVLRKRLGIKTGIKWVNDLYINDKKLAGILAEAVTSIDGKIIGFVLGMGINVYKTAITDEISDIATSLEDNGVFIESLEELTKEIVREVYLGIVADTSREEILDGYRALSVTVGRRVLVMPVGKESYEATAVGIGDDFSLTVRCCNGEILSLNSGDVKIKM